MSLLWILFFAGDEMHLEEDFKSGSPFGRSLHTNGDLSYMKNSEVATYMVARATHMLQMATFVIRYGRHLVARATLLVQMATFVIRYGRHLVARATSLVQMATTCKQEISSWSPFGRQSDRGHKWRHRAFTYKGCSSNITPHTHNSPLFSNSLNSKAVART
jgi:hypothetical protein